MNLCSHEIDAFLALEKTRRFAIAAQRCHLSPSAFSQMIVRLEEQVGARLFDRNTRNVSLTPEGEVFSHGAHRIAAEIRASVNELRERREPARRESDRWRDAVAGRRLVAAAVGRISIDAPWHRLADARRHVGALP